MTDFIFLFYKITADCDCSHGIKTIAPWKKSYDKPRQYIKKQRHHFANKVPDSQSLVFPVAMYKCASWTIEKAECQRIDAFKLWCYRRLLKVPWTARRSSQSILKKINPEYSLQGLMLKLNFQYFVHLMEKPTHWKRHWCCERLKAGREGDNRGWDGWMASLTQWTWVYASSRSWWRMVKPDVLESIRSQRVWHYLVTEQQQMTMVNNSISIYLLSGYH